MWDGRAGSEPLPGKDPQNPVPGHGYDQVMSELNPDIRSKLLTLWEIHGSPESSEIPLAALISEGIDLGDYETWRLDIEDEHRRKREILAAIDQEPRSGSREGGRRFQSPAN